MKGHTDICQFFVDKGSDVNVQDNYGDTPLHNGEYKLNNYYYNINLYFII